MKDRPLEPTRDEFFEWAKSQKNMSPELFDELPRSERLALARECGESSWLLRRRSPFWSQTAEASGADKT